MVLSAFTLGLLVGGALVALSRWRRREPAPPARRRWEAPADAYRQAFASSRDGLYLLDEHQCYVEVNRAWAEMLGCEREDLLGVPFGRRLPNASPDRPADRFRVTTRLPVARPDTKRELEMSCVPLEVQAQSFTLGRARDVTARQRAQRESEQLRAAIDAAEDGIFLTTRRGKLLYANAAAQAWLGDSATFGLLRWHVRKGAATSCEVRLDERFGRARLSPLGEVVVGSLRDVTEERRLARRRRAAEERLQEARRLESLSLLAGGIAHDFNNLLTGVQGFATLAHEAAEQEDARRYLERVLRSSERASAMTLQLRQFSQHRVGDVQELDLCAALEEVLPTLRELVGAAVQVESRVRCESAPVQGDPRQLEQLLVNLAAHAQSASQRRASARLEIALDVIELEGQRCVELQISDDCNLWQGEQGDARIFEPFAASKGLAIPAVYGIVLRHQGTIDAGPSTLGGTCFTVRLPYAEPAPGTPQPGLDLSQSQESPGEVAPVLVVDDDETVRELASSLLRGAGYEVVAEADAEGALALLNATPRRFGLLLSDVILPGRSGADLARAARELCPELPVLLMTGYADVDLPQGVPVVDKPFAPQDLLRRVRTLVFQARPAEALA